MAFDAYGSSQNSTANAVDWDALNDYVIEAADLKDGATVMGSIGMIVDLGTQLQPDAEITFTGSKEDEAAAIAEKPATYFKDGIDHETKKPVRLKCWPQKPIQCVALAVDFPAILIDKGKFFGDSNPLPLRLWLGGQFYLNKENGMVVGRPTPLKVKKDKQDRWSFAPLHLLYKLAVAGGIITKDDVFLPQQIDQLLGKSFQFECQINRDRKGYYKEYIKYVGAIGRDIPAPVSPVQGYVVGFNDDNPPEAIKGIRGHVINTLKMASNYAGSKIEAQINESKAGGQKPDQKAEAKPVEAKPSTPQPRITPVDLDLSADLPF